MSTTEMETTPEETKHETSKTISVDQKKSGAIQENKFEQENVENKNEDKKMNGQETASPIKDEAQKLLAQGKRHLFVKDYPSAVTTLGEACGKLSEQHGELADICSDAYFSYGRALLELSREESNILGNAVDPEKESEDSEEAEDDGGEDEKKDEEDSKDGEKDKEENEEHGDKNEDSDEKAGDSEGHKEADSEDNKEGDEDTEEKDEDVNNLQLAWEVFELAKIIFERQKNEAKLAETYLYLGEVALESENYESAVEDMKKCLDIQKQILEPDHRDIAETLFQLGMAYSLSNQYDEAINSFKLSLNVLEDRIKNLENKQKPDPATSDNPFYTVENEIAEIKNLLPEIKEKISDMEDFKKEAIQSVVEATLKSTSKSKDGASCSSSVQNGTADNKPATDISHLIRKKRKPEDEAESDKGKKVRSDEEKGTKAEVNNKN